MTHFLTILFALFRCGTNARTVSILGFAVCPFLTFTSV
jgi:hypothetical protein